MNRFLCSRAGTPFLLVLTLFCLFSCPILRAQSNQHLTITQPGGMPGKPIITGVGSDSNSTTITWDGPSGYYRLFQKGTAAARWKPLGPRTNLVRRATIAGIHSNEFFMLRGPSTKYAGARACLECHRAIHEKETATPHAQAFTALKAIGQDKNPSCLPCHTVGYQLPTGFVSEKRTPHLAGVQCENCHGPAANHAANPEDLASRPRAEVAATVCGGCHQGSEHPTYDGWSISGHAGVSTDLNRTDRIDSCGRCHSGTARLALLKNDPLPLGDANMPLGCVTCHDPHQLTGNPAQLRNPIASTNYFSLATSDVFTNKYDANIGICAQCHNDRGASWTESDRSPHHSPQYNMLLGTVGELESGLPPNEPGSHGRFIMDQCVACHMPANALVPSPTPHKSGSSHAMRVQSYELCRNCHPSPEGLLEFTSMAISFQIQTTKGLLDNWALTKAPPELLKYGTNAWEYTRPGELSSGSGPTSSEQQLIPVNVRKARFNMYIVLNDGSHGAHNGPYAITLLETAQQWVEDELLR